MERLRQAKIKGVMYHDAGYIWWEFNFGVLKNHETGYALFFSLSQDFCGQFGEVAFVDMHEGESTVI